MLMLRIFTWIYISSNFIILLGIIYDAHLKRRILKTPLIIWLIAAFLAIIYNYVFTEGQDNEGVFGFISAFLLFSSPCCWLYMTVFLSQIREK
jgi:hypothetical protein